MATYKWYINANGTVTSTTGTPPAGKTIFPSKAQAEAVAAMLKAQQPTTTTKPTAPTTTTPPATTGTTTGWWVDDQGVMHAVTASQPAPAGKPVYTDQNMAASAAASVQATISGTSQAHMNAEVWLDATLAQYGLQSLRDTFMGYIQQGYDSNAMAILLRQTDAYKDRFPAMATLAASGHAITEGEYLQYEVTAGQLERAYGLPAGSISGKNTIKSLLEKGVSAQELSERVQMNAAAATTAPQAVRDALRDMYGIDQGALTLHFLDPDNSLPMLEKQWASAQVKGAGTMAGVGQYMGDDTAKALAEAGVSFGTALQRASQAAAEASFMRGERGLISGQSLVEGQFGDYGYAEDAAAVEYARQSRLAAFAGQGAAYMSQSGVAGAGSASE